jgi:hypothetical protein
VLCAALHPTSTEGVSCGISDEGSLFRWDRRGGVPPGRGCGRGRRSFPRTFGANQFSESLPMKTFLRNSIDVLARVFIGLWWLLAAVGAVFVVERACYLLSGGL